MGFTDSNEIRSSIQACCDITIRFFAIYVQKNIFNRETIQPLKEPENYDINDYDMGWVDEFMSTN